MSFFGKIMLQLSVGLILLFSLVTPVNASAFHDLIKDGELEREFDS